MQVELQDPAGEPVQIQQVGDQPVQLAGVLGDPRGEVPAVIGDQAEFAAFQCQRQTEDRRQGGAQVVGHGRQEGVLHLVDLTQLLGGLPLVLQFGGELLVAFALGDIQQHPLPEIRVPVLVVDQ